MKILVTGATGRVGSRLVPRLLKRNDSVRVLVRRPERAQALEQQGAEIVIGDLLHPETLTAAVRDTNAVIHLAAFFRGATPEETQAVNLRGTIELAKAALQAGASRFVYASTNLVYGPGQGKPFREDDAPNPSSPYPATKAAAEHALLQLHRAEGLGLRILRLAFVYGEGDPHLTEGLGWFCSWNPMQQIHMVHHADVAQAVMLAADSPGIDGHVFNVADDEPVEANDILRLYNEPIGADAAGRPIDASWLQIVDTSKIRETLGYKPTYPALRDAVKAVAL